MLNDTRGCFGKALKKLLIGSGIFIGVLVLSAYLFVHFYFKRTFPNQLSGMTLRSSEGIKVKSPGGQWLPLKPSMRMVKKTTILMPESARSLVSFDGIRLLSIGASEVEVTGSRELSLLRGNVAVASAKRAKPLRISAGTTTLSTTDSALKVSGSDGRFSVECFAGTVI